METQVLTEPLMAEDLLLLRLDDARGRPRGGAKRHQINGAALLLDLAVAGLVTVSTEHGSSYHSAVVPTGEATDDPILEESLRRLGTRPRSAQYALERLGKGQFEVLGERLAERGDVADVGERWYGLIPMRGFPAANPARKQRLVRDVVDALIYPRPTSVHIASLIALLAASDTLRALAHEEGVPLRGVAHRVEKFKHVDWNPYLVADSAENYAQRAAAALKVAVHVHSPA